MCTQALIFVWRESPGVSLIFPKAPDLCWDGRGQTQSSWEEGLCFHGCPHIGWALNEQLFRLPLILPEIVAMLFAPPCRGHLLCPRTQGPQRLGRSVHTHCWVMWARRCFLINWWMFYTGHDLKYFNFKIKGILVETGLQSSILSQNVSAGFGTV